MPENLRALIVVLMLAAPALYVGRLITRSFVSRREFAFWASAWTVTTIAEFVCQSYLLFASALIIVCLYARFARYTSVALFIVLLFAAPLVNIPISIPGLINNLIVLNHARLLAIVLLLPAILVTTPFNRKYTGYLRAPDRFIVIYVLVVLALQFREANLTSLMRSAAQLTLDILIPYFAFSRTITSIEQFRKIAGSFLVAVLPLALVAVFELVKNWPLYDSVIRDWGGVVSYAGREGMFRGLASAGPIVLGYIIVVAIGCLLATPRRTAVERNFGAIAFVVFIVGLVATLSRGPWVGALVLFFVYLATGPRAIENLAKSAIFGALTLAIFLLTPFGQRFFDLLPFIGSADAGTITYRQNLFANAMEVIERNLLFGTPDYLSTPEMQKMIQGQGIIDVVNSYLQIALATGLTGLVLFIGFFITILVGLRRVVISSVKLDAELNVSARALMATMIAILVTIATASGVSFVPYVYWSFAGLCVGFVRLARWQGATARRGAPQGTEYYRVTRGSTLQKF